MQRIPVFVKGYPIQFPSPFSYGVGGGKQRKNQYPMRPIFFVCIIQTLLNYVLKGRIKLCTKRVHFLDER